MSSSYCFRLPLVILILSLCHCSGYDRAMLATKTNVGLDLDSQPPTAELTIARREIAIQPTFPNYHGDSDRALPLLASFGKEGNFLNPHITGHFAGGGAAIHLVQEEIPQNSSTSSANTSSAQDDPGTLCLQRKPEDTRGPLLKFWHFITGRSGDWDKEPRPFYFATDTAFGLKVAWSGTTGPYPDSLKLGYNRKEFASPPIFVEQNRDTGDQADPKVNATSNSSRNDCKFTVKMPSFYASINNVSALEDPRTSSNEHVQFFSTGAAANEYTRRASVRQMAFRHMNPEAARLELGLRELLLEISLAFEQANDAKKDAILNKAKESSLVGNTTTVDTFVTTLQAANKDTANFTTLKNLFALKHFAQNG